MPRHHTIGYPRRFVETETVDGVEVPAHWVDAYQEDIAFTSAEETVRDTEEAQADVDQAAADVKVARRVELTQKLTDDTITDAELRELLRLERQS